MTAQTTFKAVRTRVVSPPNGRAAGALAIALVTAAVSLMTVICVSGKSAAVADVGSGALPLHFDAGLSDRLVTLLCWAAVIVGGLGSGAGLLALSRGWRPRPRTLLIWSAVAVVALTVVSVAGSTDVLDYAVYGRIASLGHDPYRLTPGWLVRIGDPVGHYAPISWRHTPSLYGPLAIGLFSLASTIGGTSMAATVFILKLVAGAAFLATGFGLDRLAGPDPVARARVHLLWTLNPVMLWGMVAGAHVDAIAAALIVGAILALRWSTRSARTNTAPAGAAASRTGVTGATATGAGATGGGATGGGATHADASRGVLGDAVARTAMRAALTGLLAGTLLGAATAIKLPYVLAGIGLIWMVRRSPVTILCGAAATAIVTGGGYLIAGRTSITALTRNAGGRSEIDPWNLLDRHFHFLKPLTTSAGALAILAFVVLTALVWWSLSGRAASDPMAATGGHLGIAGTLRAARGQGWAQVPGATPGTGDASDRGESRGVGGRSWTVALVPAFAIALGWLATSPYQHPWYDAMLFPLLALLPRTRLDGLIVARGAVAWIGYIPGDPSRLSPPWFNHLVKGTLMSRVVPFALDLVIFGICLACLPITLHLAERFTRRLRS
jgi:hypothetical protein